jgi:sialic acid synthase SpsE
VKNITFAGKQIGDGHPTFITFEAGPTHSGLDSAKQLVQHASEAGADAVKFQIFDPDELIADKNLVFSYEVLKDRESGETEVVSEPLYNIFVRRSLSEGEWMELKSYSDSLGLAFFATIGDELGLSLVESIGCESIKIASADVNHFPLIRKVAKTGVSIQLDTGSASFGEIEKAVDVIRSEGNDKIIIHNCPSGYPAHLESINLRTIQTLKTMFQVPIAYSDHTPGETMDVAAIALGANLIEKTITQDRTTRSIEHIMSLEPNEMKEFVYHVRQLEVALGHTRRILSEEEKGKRNRIRRSVILDQDVSPGDKLGEIRVKFKRPGFGVSPENYESLCEKSFNKKVRKGELLSTSDLI